MNKKGKNKTIFLLIAVAIIAIVLFANPAKIREEYFESLISQTEKEILPAKQEVPKRQELPNSHLLTVPFQSQAPDRNWAEPYQNACEEASIVMVKYFYTNAELTTPVMKSEIDQSVAWQIQNYDGHHDLDAVRTLKLAEEYFGLSGEVIADYSLDSIKRLVFDGTPVIAPTAGRILANPGYTAPGPVYHMIVIIGYDDASGVFITNDPGVNHGANFEFPYQRVLDAISGPNQNMAKEIVVLN